MRRARSSASIRDGARPSPALVPGLESRRDELVDFPCCRFRSAVAFIVVRPFGRELEKCVEAARIVPDARRLASPDRQKYAAFTRIGFVVASPGSPFVVAARFAVTAVLRERPDCSLHAG